MTKKIIDLEYSVILDTSFLIRLVKENDPLHKNAIEYFKYFRENNHIMYISTISVAEFCVKGKFTEIPFQKIRVLPFNLSEAKEAGRYASALFDAKAKGYVKVENRNIIPNDAKIFAQGALIHDIKYFVTSDTNSKKHIEILRSTCGADIQHLDIHQTLPSQPSLFDNLESS